MTHPANTANDGIKLNPLQPSDALWHHTFASRQRMALHLHLSIRRKYEVQQK